MQKNSKKKYLLVLFSLLIVFTLSLCLFGCGDSNKNKDITLKKDLPTTMLYGEELYLREYLPFEYGSEYELFVTYTDRLENKTHTNEKLDSLLFRFDAIADYSFTLKRAGGKKELSFNISVFPPKPMISPASPYIVAVGEEMPLSDLLFWCNANLVDESAQKDPDFKWTFSKVVVQPADVDGEDTEIDLTGKDSYVFNSEAIYNFYLSASNRSGSDNVILECSNIDQEKNSYDITGYVLEDSKNKANTKITFTIPNMATPNDKTVLPARIGNKKFDAVYNQELGKFVISNPDYEFVNSVKYRLYIKDTNGVNYSSIIVLPDLILTKDNISKLQTIKDGFIIMSEDIDMKGVKWGNDRKGLEYGAYRFRGVFDGQGYTISNFTTGDYAYAGGLFWSAEGALFKNVVFDNAVVTRSNSVLVGRTSNMTRFENIAVKVSNMNMYNAGIIAGPSESFIEYHNCLLYLASDYYGNINGSGFFGGFYARSVITDNVYTITSTKLPLGPVHEEIDTTIQGQKQLHQYNINDAKKELPTMDLGTTLLNNAVTTFFAPPKDAVHIKTVEDLRKLELATSGYYILDNDIDMKGIKNWGESRVGKVYSDYYFKGTLDGNGHTISNFATTKAPFAGGLLWSIDGATIKNLVINNATLSNLKQGIIAGRTRNSAKIENVAVSVTINEFYNNGLLAPVEDAVYKDTIIYVKGDSKKITQSGFLGGMYARKANVKNLYCVTDTSLALAPSGFMTEVKKEKVEIVTVVNNLLNKPAVKDTDYFTYTLLQARQTLMNKDLGSDLLNNASKEFFKEIDTRVHLNQDNFNLIKDATTGNYVLDSDIDLAGAGEWENKGLEFKGVFDGNGHTIKNMSTTNVQGKNALFGVLGGSAVIKNLAMVNVKTAGNNPSSPIATRSVGENVTIENVYTEVTGSTGFRNTGLIGYQTAGKLTMKNVFIDYKPTTSISDNGFISSYIGAEQVLDGVFCLGHQNRKLHGNNDVSGKLNYKNINGEPAQKGVDYDIFVNVNDFTASDLYTSCSQFIKDKLNANYGDQLQIK